MSYEGNSLELIKAILSKDTKHLRQEPQDGLDNTNATN